MKKALCICLTTAVVAFVFASCQNGTVSNVESSNQPQAPQQEQVAATDLKISGDSLTTNVTGVADEVNDLCKELDQQNIAYTKVAGSGLVTVTFSNKQVPSAMPEGLGKVKGKSVYHMHYQSAITCAAAAVYGQPCPVECKQGEFYTPVGAAIWASSMAGLVGALWFVGHKGHCDVY